MSDWSSDVFSSDLYDGCRLRRPALPVRPVHSGARLLVPLEVRRMASLHSHPRHEGAQRYLGADCRRNLPTWVAPAPRGAKAATGKRVAYLPCAKSLSSRRLRKGSPSTPVVVAWNGSASGGERG